MRYSCSANVADVKQAHKNLTTPTSEAIDQQGPFHIWVLESLVDLAEIGSQLPEELGRPYGSKLGRISCLYPYWSAWLRTEDGTSDRGTHEQLKDILREGKQFRTRPILFDDNRQINDGKHRLFAVYEFAIQEGVLPKTEVFWSRAEAAGKAILGL